VKIAMLEARGDAALLVGRAPRRPARAAPPGRFRPIAESTLEYAVLLCVRASDKEGFQRNMAQLKAYYGSPALAARSAKRRMILGLHLLFLLVENRLAEFHSELELLAPEDLASSEVQFSAGLERALVVGTYDEVSCPRGTSPGRPGSTAAPASKNLPKQILTRVDNVSSTRVEEARSRMRSKES